jgi:membrane-anchored glycerophosphoryl diester phosphodiesterase (GDPDase)
MQPKTLQYFFHLRLLSSIVYFIKINSSQLDWEADKGFSGVFAFLFLFFLLLLLPLWSCGLIEIWEWKVCLPQYRRIDHICFKNFKKTTKKRSIHFFVLLH